MARIDAFLKLGLAQNCSDIHLAVGVPPMLRMHGDLLPIKFRDLTGQELEAYIDEILLAAYYWETVQQYNNKQPPADFPLKQFVLQHAARRPDVEREFILENRSSF